MALAKRMTGEGRMDGLLSVRSSAQRRREGGSLTVPVLVNLRLIVVLQEGAGVLTGGEISISLSTLADPAN